MEAAFSTAPAPRASRWLLRLVALQTLVSPFVADWNVTHIYNPRWPPHAKFHNAQTMLLGVALGLGTLWFSARPAATAPARRVQLQAAALLAATYWLSQAFSGTFPGSAFIDPEFGPLPYVLGLPVQVFVDVVTLSIVALAYYLGRERMG